MTIGPVGFRLGGDAMAMRRAWGWLAVGLVAAGLAASPGCSKANNKRLPVYPAKGEVWVNGKPAAGVFIYLWPDGIAAGKDAYCPHGQSDDSGRFTLSTYESNDGAPAGNYRVTAEWPVRYNPISAQWEGDKLKGRFTDNQASKLSVTIQAGPNEIPTIKLD